MRSPVLRLPKMQNSNELEEHQPFPGRPGTVSDLTLPTCRRTVACSRVHRLELKAGLKALSGPLGFRQELDVEVWSSGQDFKLGTLVT